MSEPKNHGDGQPAVSLPPASLDSKKLASGLKSAKKDETISKVIDGAMLGEHTKRPEPDVAPDQKLVKVDTEHGETEQRVSIAGSADPDKPHVDSATTETAPKPAS